VGRAIADEAHAHADIDLLVDRIRHLVRQAHVQHDLGVLALQLGQQRQHEAPADGAGCSDAHAAGHLVPAPADVALEQLVEAAQGLPRLGRQQFAVGGDLHLSRAAMEQRLAHQLLQVLDRPGHRL